MTVPNRSVDLKELLDVPADARLPTEHGNFRIRVFHEDATGFDHVALTLGDMSGPDAVLVRVHSECLTGDAFGNQNCIRISYAASTEQIKMAIKRIKSAIQV